MRINCCLPWGPDPSKRLPHMAKRATHAPPAVANPFQNEDARSPGVRQAQASAETCLVSRESFRDAVFLWRTPLATPRASSGWAA